MRRSRVRSPSSPPTARRPGIRSIDSQVVALKSARADVFVQVTTVKFGAMAIRKTFDIGWRPLHIVAFPSSSVATVLEPAGLNKSVGVISSAFLKDPTDAGWKDDAATTEYRAWMKRYYPQGDADDMFNVFGYTAAQTLVQVLKQCGDDLTRENVMKQAASLNNLELPMLLPGIVVATSRTHFRPISAMQLIKFDGKQWRRFGEVIR